ncbi:MAG: hypothetical protein RIE06_03675 [Roseibium album]
MPDRAETAIAGSVYDSPVDLPMRQTAHQQSFDGRICDQTH